MHWMTCLGSAFLFPMVVGNKGFVKPWQEAYIAQQLDAARLVADSWWCMHRTWYIHSR